MIFLIYLDCYFFLYVNTSKNATVRTRFLFLFSIKPMIYENVSCLSILFLERDNHLYGANTKACKVIKKTMQHGYLTYTIITAMLCSLIKPKSSLILFKMKNENKLNLISCFIAILSIWICGFRILQQAPDTQTQPHDFNMKRENKIIHNSNCCISTHFSKNKLDQLLLLGYSIAHTGQIPPKLLAFTNDHPISEKEIESISKFFKIVDKSKEMETYINEECFPVVSVSVEGVFNKSPWDICEYVSNKTLPAAVPQHSDILYPDSNLFVFDPKTNPKNKTTSEGYFQSFQEWTPLPADFYVYDYQNEFLDFWTRYGNPTFIYYSSETYSKLISKSKKHGDGSFRLYKILQRIYNDWQNDFHKTSS